MNELLLIFDKKENLMLKVKITNKKFLLLKNR
jgi:hypothetical protein